MKNKSLSDLILIKYYKMGMIINKISLPVEYNLSVAKKMWGNFFPDIIFENNTDNNDMNFYFFISTPKNSTIKNEQGFSMCGDFLAQNFKETYSNFLIKQLSLNPSNDLNLESLSPKDKTLIAENFINTYFQIVINNKIREISWDNKKKNKVNKEFFH